MWHKTTISVPPGKALGWSVRSLVRSRFHSVRVYLARCISWLARSDKNIPGIVFRVLFFCFAIHLITVVMMYFEVQQQYSTVYMYSEYVCSDPLKQLQPAPKGRVGKHPCGTYPQHYAALLQPSAPPFSRSSSAVYLPVLRPPSVCFSSVLEYCVGPRIY